MNEQMKQIAARVTELREILGFSQVEVAAYLNLPLDEYKEYEIAKKDMTIGVIYGLASLFKIDPTVILTGDTPRMDAYTVVKKGEGLKVERYKGYSFSSLAFNYKDRDMDPMIVTIKKNDKNANLVPHGGQEFNYCLKGTMKVTVGAKEVTLNEGDSIYFSSSIPHKQCAVTDEAVFLTVLNEKNS